MPDTTEALKGNLVLCNTFPPIARLHTDPDEAQVLKTHLDSHI